jgi:hypothetical protein
MASQQRQGTKGRQQQPGQPHQQEAVARLQLAPEAAGGQAHQQAAARVTRWHHEGLLARGRARTSAKASGTSISSANSTTMRPTRATTASRGIHRGGSEQEGGADLEQLSTSRTMRLRGTKTITWSRLDHRVVVG